MAAMSSTAASSLIGARPLASRRWRTVTRGGAINAQKRVVAKDEVSGRAPFRHRHGGTISTSTTRRRTVTQAAYDSTRSLAVRSHPFTHLFAFSFYFFPSRYFASHDD